MKMNKIWLGLLLYGCNPVSQSQSFSDYFSIEYVGESNKMSSILVFTDDKNYTRIDPDYDVTQLTKDDLVELFKCVPSVSDTIIKKPTGSDERIKLKIESSMDSVAKVILIRNKNKLSAFFSCTKDFLSSHNLGDVYSELREIEAKSNEVFSVSFSARLRFKERRGILFCPSLYLIACIQ